jgi:hypothetical protein
VLEALVAAFASGTLTETVTGVSPRGGAVLLERVRLDQDLKDIGFHIDWLGFSA